MTSDQEYNYDVAQVIIDLKGNGNPDPSIEEISLKLLKRVMPFILDDLTKRLNTVQKIVRAETVIDTTCLVGPGYYIERPARGGSYRVLKPATPTEAHQCLPLGQGVRPAGFRFAKGEDDIIYQASISLHLRSASGSLASGIKRIKHGNEAGYIPNKKAAKIIKDAHQLAINDEALRIEQLGDT